MDGSNHNIKRIGILTSGGDAPGMNAVIRSVVRTAHSYGVNCTGILHGYSGLINGEFRDMNARSVDGILRHGGTILYTARCMDMLTEEGAKRAAQNAHYLGLDGLVVCGGDGSFRGAQVLSRLGVPTVGIPGTIDNDIACTDYTIGFDTACNTAIDAIDKLLDTMQSHDRCSVVEVMGRNAGHLALQVGTACGATAILVPEREPDFDHMVFERMRADRIRGKNHHLIIVAEGVGHAHDIANRIHDETGTETRLTVLGYIQRGGAPTLRDRIVATEMGYHAVRTLLDGRENRVVVSKNNCITDIDIEEGLSMTKDLDQELYEISQNVSI
jgi:6-phosphofructokinase 1